MERSKHGLPTRGVACRLPALGYDPRSGSESAELPLIVVLRRVSVPPALNSPPPVLGCPAPAVPLPPGPVPPAPPRLATGRIAGDDAVLECQAAGIQVNTASLRRTSTTAIPSQARDAEDVALSARAAAAALSDVGGNTEVRERKASACCVQTTPLGVAAVARRRRRWLP